jgi:glycosyltransferase involved in cell wall biosynthesis
MNELISVVIPTYNRSRTILHSVRSVLAQTYRNIEVIVVDDGSTDNSIDLLKTLDDERVRIIKTHHNGACAARNIGISNSFGQYIAFQDSDDLWLSGKLATQYENLNKFEADVDFCRMLSISSNKTSYVPPFEISSNLDYHKKLIEGNFISTQMILANIKCFEFIKFDENLLRFQDWDLVLRLTEHYKFSYSDEVLVHQIIGTDSISSDLNKATVSLRYLNDKHSTDFKNNRSEYSKFLYNWASLCWNSLTQKERSSIFRESISYDARFKNIIKYILSRLSIFARTSSHVAKTDSIPPAAG